MLSDQKIEETFLLLYHTVPQDQQDEAIQFLIDNIGEKLEMLVLPIPESSPINPKMMWDNAARVIVGIGEEGIAGHFPKIFEWLQDINWPGSRQILDFLADIDTDTIEPHLKAAEAKAESAGDPEWIYNLGLLREERQRRHAPITTPQPT